VVGLGLCHSNTAAMEPSFTSITADVKPTKTQSNNLNNSTKQ